MVGWLLRNHILDIAMAVLKQLIRITHHEDYSVIIWYAVWIIAILSLLWI